MTARFDATIARAISRKRARVERTLQLGAPVIVTIAGVEHADRTRSWVFRSGTERVVMLEGRDGAFPLEQVRLDPRARGW